MNEPLHLAEAVPLGYAVLAQLAEDVGARALAIKGPILSLQGLREPRQSVDIDVLVHPDDFAGLTSALNSIGWRDDHVYGTPTLVPRHSVNHRHPHWPLEVDVHKFFPGFLADPVRVFDVMWARRVEVEVAHRQVPTLDRVAHAALAALHYLRDDGKALHTADFENMAVAIASAALSTRPASFGIAAPTFILAGGLEIARRFFRDRSPAVACRTAPCPVASTALIRAARALARCS
jgi:hypothetical protein